uniref:Uncharacterized protein n=1 Tax=Strongyloides venezuelensis TaxID=75913 RepID=A0A0K0FFS6_STRVS
MGFILLLIYLKLFIILSESSPYKIRNIYNIEVEGEVYSYNGLRNGDLGIYIMVLKPGKSFDNTALFLKDEIYSKLNQGIYCKINWRINEYETNFAKEICYAEEDTHFISKECVKESSDACALKNVDILIITPKDFQFKEVFDTFNITFTINDIILQKKFNIVKKNKYFIITSNGAERDHQFFKNIVKDDVTEQDNDNEIRSVNF